VRTEATTYLGSAADWGRIQKKCPLGGGACSRAVVKSAKKSREAGLHEPRGTIRFDFYNWPGKENTSRGRRGGT